MYQSYIDWDEGGPAFRGWGSWMAGPTWDLAHPSAPVSRDSDSGRALAYLDKADGWDYSVEAARAGAARSYVYHGHPSARADEIAAVEQEAKAAGRDLWGPPCFGQTTSVPI